MAEYDENAPSAPLHASVSDEKPAVVVADPDTAQAGTRALGAAIEAAWVDSSRHRLLITGTPGASGPYAPTRWNCDCGESGDGSGIEAAKHVVASGIRAAAPLIPVSEQQRADIERGALLRAAEVIRAAAAKYTDPEIEERAYRDGMRIAASMIDDPRTGLIRAAPVGTEEGRDG